MIAIPTSFELGGREWTVKFAPTIPGENDRTYGLCDSHEAVIFIKEGMSPDATQHTFYHELCHAFCFTLGWDKLNGDEDKIDALGGLLYQFLKKKKGRLI